jgi:hypothetical protein
VLGRGALVRKEAQELVTAAQTLCRTHLVEELDQAVPTSAVKRSVLTPTEVSYASCKPAAPETQRLETPMAEKLVDVIHHGSVIHTYPVTLSDKATDGEFIARALEAAAHGQLVPDDQLGSLTGEMHVSRGGSLGHGDPVAGDSETKAGLARLVRERAHALWEQDGCPEGRDEEYWFRARDEHLRERAYVLWQQEGSPEGGADEYWNRLRDFQGD